MALDLLPRRRLPPYRLRCHGAYWMPLLRSTIRTHLDRWMVSVDSQREAHDSESFRLKKNSFNYIYIDLLPLFITLVGSSSLKIHLFRTVSFLKKCNVSTIHPYSLLNKITLLLSIIITCHVLSSSFTSLIVEIHQTSIYFHSQIVNIIIII